MAQTLTALGANGTLLSQITNWATVQDVTTMAGTYPTQITNAKLVTSLQEAASQLQAVYAFSGFLPPLDKATFSRGSTIPVKFALTDGSGRAVTTAVAQLTVSQLRPDGTLVSVDVILSGGTNQANLFRSGAVYVYNLSTMNLAAGNYVLRILLYNVTNYVIKIALQ